MTETQQSQIGCAEKIHNVYVRHFVMAQSLQAHPLIKANSKIRTSYYTVLDYFVKMFSLDSEYTDSRLAQYRDLLVGNNARLLLTDKNCDVVMRSLVNSVKPWKKRYKYLLMCDISLVLLDDEAIQKAHKLLIGYLRRNKEIVLIDGLIEKLYSNESIPSTFIFADELIRQFRANRKFAMQAEKRIMVTANMSAGKSTLINAIIGKLVTRTSQEACTANLCFLYNKPFEDDAVHLIASPLNLNATHNDLNQTVKLEISHVASFFRTVVQPQVRICIIDTPGVNFTINRNHGELTRMALAEERYDKLIYIFNANKLGTDEEFRHLKFVSENVPKDKVVFVLNKLDDFKNGEDSVETSIEGVRNDLLGFGFENPIICPLSAYFALLIKMKQNGESLTEDESDAYDLYIKKFSKPENDLSLYYNGDSRDENHIGENETVNMAVKCGNYGLENLLFGGKS